MEPIRSPRNPKIVAAGRLHRAKHRRATNTTLLEGPRIVAEAAEAGWNITTVFAAQDHTDGLSIATAAAASCGADLVMVSPAMLKKVAGTEHPAGPVAVAEIPASTPPDPACDVLILYEIADPGNVGALIRSAAAFGFDVIAIGGADPWSPKALRAAAGAHIRTALRDAPARLAELPHRLVATAPAGGAGEIGAAGPVALIIGSEAHGLPPEVMDEAGEVLSVPMRPGVESLNAAVAGSLAMFMVANTAGRLDHQH